MVQQADAQIGIATGPPSTPFSAAGPGAQARRRLLPGHGRPQRRSGTGGGLGPGLPWSFKDSSLTHISCVLLHTLEEVSNKTRKAGGERSGDRSPSSELLAVNVKRNKKEEKGNFRVETFLMMPSQRDAHTVPAVGLCQLFPGAGAWRQCHTAIQFSKNQLAIKPRMFGNRY